MPLRTAEAFILRSYPLKESDKIVSFFAREFGKCRAVARGARRPKSKFGSMLEPLSQVRLQFFEREGKDLANLDHGELLQSMVAASATDLVHSVAVSLMVEVADRMLPDHEPNDAVFRLLAAVLAGLRAAGEPAVWPPLTYYLFWMVRLGGFLPAFTEHDLDPASLDLATALARLPLPALPPITLAATASAPGRLLRQRLKGCIEDHLESRLQSWPILLGLDSVLPAPHA